MPELTQPLIVAGTSVLSAAIGTLAAILVRRKPALMSAEATAQSAVNDGFAKLAAALTEQLMEARREIQELRGEIADLTQHLYSLETVLRKENIPIPLRVRPHIMTVVPRS